MSELIFKSCFKISGWGLIQAKWRGVTFLLFWAFLTTETDLNSDKGFPVFGGQRAK
jgi:hypothetical protein